MMIYKLYCSDVLRKKAKQYFVSQLVGVYRPFSAQIWLYQRWHNILST